MKLKYRLVVSFLIIVFLPLILVAILLFTTDYLGNTLPGGFYKPFSGLTNNIGEFTEQSEEAYREISDIIEKEPDRFLDEDFLRIYNDNNDILLRQKDITYSDGTTGKVIFVEGRKQGERDSQKVILDTFVSIILVLVFTAIILTLWIYNGVISKVNRLIYGANNIKEGNLDFSIATEGSDELSELINTFEDMKERLRRDSEEKLLIEKEQRELISNIAHDIKTPLTAIRGYAEGLSDGIADTEQKQQAYIRTIQKKAEELNVLLNELTVYSNISTNRIPYNFRQINANRYFKDLAEELSITYDSASVGCRFDIDIPEDTEFIADPQQLRRVVENIVENSIKYKKEKEPFVSFSAALQDGFIQCRIEDNGIGIKNEDLPRIFDRMYRGDPSRNSSVKGSGIGLSIAKKIIEDHGGKIWATSRQNEGSCFYFIIRQYVSPKEKDS